jgi:hypothetical protein
MAKYISRRRELRIVLKPSYNKEVDGRVVTTPGLSARFSDGVYETEDQEIIAALEAHPNFGEGPNGEFIKVPDNVGDLVGERAERFKDLETKEKELAAKEKELKEREHRIQGNEEGAKTGKPESDGLEDLKRDQLVVIAEKEGLLPEQFKVGIKNSAIVESIRAKRNEAKKPGDEGKPKEGEPAF